MRRALQVVALLCTIVVGAASIAVIVTQTAWFRDWLRGFIVRQADDYLNGRLSIGRLGGNLFFGVELEDVRLTAEGQPVVYVKDLGLDYNAFTLLSRGLVLDDIRINEPELHLRKTAEGWNLGAIVKKQEKEADREGPGKPIAIGSIGISDGTLLVEGVGTSGVDVPHRIDRLDARIAFDYKPVDYTVTIDHVSFRGADPAFGLNALSGRISTRNDALYFDDVSVRTEQSSLSIDGAVQQYLTTPRLNLTVSSDKLAIAEIARLVPALRGIRLQPSFELKAAGPLDRLAVSANARSSAGTVNADITADVMAPGRSLAGTVRLQHVNVAAVVPLAPPSDITGNAQLDLRMRETSGSPLDALDGTYRIEAPRVAAYGYDIRDITAHGRLERGRVYVAGKAAAYGGRATVDGWIRPSAPLALDVRGRAEHLNVRNLPASLKAPKIDTDLTAAYHAQGRLGPRADLEVTADLDRSRFAGATIDSGSTVRLTIQGSRIGYAANASVHDLDLQRVGEGLRIQALAADRFATDVNGSFDVSGSGTSLPTLALTARGTLVDSRLFGGTVPRLAFDATVADGGLRLAAQGGFAGFDPAAVSGNPSLAGQVAGTLDVNAAVRNLSGPFTPDAVNASGRVTLSQSRVGPFALTTAVVAGRYANRAGDLQTLQIQGPDVSVKADGHVDLTPDGATNLRYSASLVSLDPIATLTGRAMSGGVAADGTVTGNGTALTTTGTLHVNNVRYGENSVLAATSRYTVRLPDVQPAAAEVNADTRASFVHAAGMDLTEIQARTTWKPQNLGLDATLRDKQRELAVRADVTLHPDHQEVHLHDLALRTEGVEWRTAPGSEAAIQYGADRVAVEQLAFVSAGGQKLTANGAFGGPQDRLTITADHVDLSTVDRLALGNYRLAGRLNATATVTGTREAPRADARFAIADGAVRDFKYASFGGTVQYAPDGARLDVRLSQTPQAWIAAKGVVPSAAWRSAPSSGAARGHEAAPPGGGLDVAVTSSPIDLSIVQGFVPQVSKASGQMQADLRVTNTVRDPHLTGYFEIRNGALTVADLTKDGYTGLNTRITFEPDRVHIGNFTILDEHQHPLHVGGDLSLHGRQVGAVQIAIDAEEFEVVDNDLADVKLNSKVRIGGELRAPRVDGEVSVHTGTINVDQVLQLVTSNPYAERPEALDTSPATTTPASAPGAKAPAAAATGAPAPSAPQASAPVAQNATTPAPGGGIMDAATLNLRIKVPNNLIVKGKNLNPSGSSPIGLGNLNVTLGGDLRVDKPADAPLMLVGAVNTVRGTYEFQGRRFEIQRDGTIQFVGAQPIDPRLDITATRLISGVEAIVHVQGSARQPKLTLASRPPMEEADILSLIIFNQPANSLGEGEQVSLAQRASALATGFVASTLADSIGKALELDVFEVQAAPENGGGPTVTIGEQLGERLFVKLQQAFGAQSVSQFIVEYQIADYLRLQSSVAQGAVASQRTLLQRYEQAGIDLIFYFTY